MRSYHRFKNNKDMNIEEQIEETVQYYLSDKEKLMRERKKKINELSNEENNS
jgi:penicillin-binding protein-related factor A (putative recombinase)